MVARRKAAGAFRYRDGHCAAPSSQAGGAVAFVWTAVAAGHRSSKHCLTGQGIQNFCAGTIIIIKFRHLR